MSETVTPDELVAEVMAHIDTYRQRESDALTELAELRRWTTLCEAFCFQLLDIAYHQRDLIEKLEGE